MSYVFLGAGPPGTVKLKEWRGEHAPALPRQAADAMRIETFEIESEFLGESRGVTVVLPKGDHVDLPVLIMADGQGVRQWAGLAGALIEDGRTRPFALVGIHSGGYGGDRSQPHDPKLDYRGREYIESDDPERFALHLRWVLEEVLPAVAERYSLSTRREDVAVAGFSNGGAFAAAAGVRAPDRFGSIIAMSVGVPLRGDRPDGPLPHFYLAAGELEQGFLKGTLQVRDLLRSWDQEPRFEPFVAGHDPAMWDLAMVTFAPEVFAPHK